MTAFADQEGEGPRPRLLRLGAWTLFGLTLRWHDGGDGKELTVEHTSGFRPPGRDVAKARRAKRAKHDHASENYQRHLAERFRARQAEQADAVREPEEKDADASE